MSDGIIFELYQDSDAEQVVELLNRNRFHTARHKKVTPEDYRFTLRSRGYHFIVLAKKNGKVIGTAAAYPTSDQGVAKPHQVYVGSFLVDNHYRLSYSIIVGLYDTLMKGLVNTDYKEILSSVRPENQASYNLMLKCGFVLLKAEPNDFGRYEMHCFTPALSMYAGADSVEVNSNTLFSSLPIVNRKEARKFQPKPRLHERYIECDYKLEGQQVTLLFDVVNAKIDGGIIPKQIKIYPDFTTPGQYILENLHKTKPLHTSFQLTMEPTSGQPDVNLDITLKAGQNKVIPCSKDVKALKFKYDGKWYHLYPNLIWPAATPKEPIPLDGGVMGNFIPVLDPNTGFLSIMERDISSKGVSSAKLTQLATLVWPIPIFPYMEGINAPRIKDLAVEQLENGVTVIEDTPTYRLTRTFLFSEEANHNNIGRKMTVTTTLLIKSEDVNVRPISQLYANKGVQGYTLITDNKEMVYDASKIKHQGFEYSDYTYWDTEPELFADAPLRSISLLYESAVVEVSVDRTSEIIVHAPFFVSTLPFEHDKLLEEQVIEQLQICYRMEEK